MPLQLHRSFRDKAGVDRDLNTTLFLSPLREDAIPTRPNTEHDEIAFRVCIRDVFPRDQPKRCAVRVAEPDFGAGDGTAAGAMDKTPDGAQATMNNHPCLVIPATMPWVMDNRLRFCFYRTRDFRLESIDTFEMRVQHNCGAMNLIDRNLGQRQARCTAARRMTAQRHRQSQSDHNAADC